MSLKINPSLSIELAEDVGNGKFLLHGHNNLDGIIPYIKEMQEGLFSNHYDAGDYILYEASLVSDGQKHFQEIGLGIFSIEDNKCFIQRRHALYCIDEEVMKPTRLGCYNFSVMMIVINALYNLIYLKTLEKFFMPHILLCLANPRTYLQL